MAKHEDGMYHKCSFSGGINIDLRLITCEDNIVILPILQKYVLHWYHTYLLHPGMDRTEAIICQHFYWPVIRESAPKEVRNCDTLQNTKL